LIAGGYKPLYKHLQTIIHGPRLLDASGTVLQFSLPLTPRGTTSAVGHCAVSLAEPKLWSAEAGLQTVTAEVNGLLIRRTDNVKIMWEREAQCHKQGYGYGANCDPFENTFFSGLHQP